MLLLASLVPFLVAISTAAYQVEIHPEYQQGQAINDVPAERRLHWMRVANEVGRICALPSRSYLISGRQSMQMVIRVRKPHSGLPSSIPHRTSWCASSRTEWGRPEVCLMYYSQTQTLIEQIQRCTAKSQLYGIVQRSSPSAVSHHSKSWRAGKSFRCTRMESRERT
jgi:hypothetical protein